MKKILRYFLLFIFSLITVNQVLGNLSFRNMPETLLLVALILTIFEVLLKPIIKLLLLPITILTLGLIRTIIDTLGIYLALFLISDFKVDNINIPSSQYQGIIIPAVKFNDFWAVFITSALLSLFFYIYLKILTIKKAS